MVDVSKDFPALQQTVRNGKPLVFLDSAATAQKPRQVLDAIERFYARDYGSVHRGVYELAERATAAYEHARKRTARFINAPDPRGVVFLRGATEALNLLAATLPIKAGDEIVITHLEHHSNIVPWQLLAGRTGAILKVVPIDDNGDIDRAAYTALLSPRTKVVSMTHVSNTLGTVVPIREMAEEAHAHGALVIVDGAQSAPHMAIDVQALGCDFFVFSGHKLYGPTGIGVLWGKYELLDKLPPYQGGGQMITTVTFARTTYAKPPQRFEAGTPNAEGAIGLAAAMDYLEAIGVDAIAAHEAELLNYAIRQLKEVAGLRFIGAPKRRAGVVSFTLDVAHPHDVASILDREGIAVRAGHHCTQPVMQRFDVPATTRASFGVYNTKADVDALVRGLLKVREVFHG